MFISDIFPTISSVTRFRDTLPLMNCLICRHTTSFTPSFHINPIAQKFKTPRELIVSYAHFKFHLKLTRPLCTLILHAWCTVDISILWDLHHFNTYFGTTNLSVNLILHIIANTNVSLRFHECLDPKTMFLVFQHFFFYFGFSGDFVSRKKNLCNEKKKIVAFNEIWASLGVIFFCVMSKRASRASKTFFWASFWGVKILYITALNMRPF